jgi:hypothetical protein
MARMLEQLNVERSDRILEVGTVRLTLAPCVACFRPSPPPFTLVSASTTARVAERQTRRT